MKRRGEREQPPEALRTFLRKIGVEIEFSRDGAGANPHDDSHHLNLLWSK
jgi:hypothetical protein